MSLNRFMILSVLGLVFLQGCSDEDKFDSTALREQVLKEKIQTFQFQTQDERLTFETAAGCTLSIYGDGYSHEGIPITGDIKIEYIEIFDKGTMLITGKHTMSDQGLLQSGGEFYTQASQNGKLLDLQFSYRIRIPASLTGGVEEEMKLFAGGTELESSQEWEVVAPVSDIIGLFAFEFGYNLFNTSFGWFNCDKFYDEPDPKTRIKVKIPKGFVSTNVYVALVGEKNVLGLLGDYLIPVGKELHIILTSESEQNFLYAIKSVTVVDNMEVEFSEDEIISIEPDDLVDVINALP